MVVIFEKRKWQVVGYDNEYYFLRCVDDNKKFRFFEILRTWKVIKNCADVIYIDGLKGIIESCRKLNNNIDSFDDNDYFRYALKERCKPLILMETE